MAAGTYTLPPGGLMEIVFSFDTTGSMSSILEEVQGRLQDMIQRLQADIPGIRIGVIAHGDYCDKDVFYLTQELDFCTDVVELCNFVKGVGGTGGGDADECYELILRMVRQKFSWTHVSQKILVMIGDANPHEPEYELNVDNIDWRQEINHLKNSGVKIYGVQAFEHEGVEDFYKTMALQTDGHYLRLGEFSNICDFLMAICYRERGEHLFTEYEAEVRSRYGPGGINRELEGLFGTLRKNESGASSTSSTASCPIVVPPPKVTSPKMIKGKAPVPLRKQKPGSQQKKPIVKKQKQVIVFQKNLIHINRKAKEDSKLIHREKVTRSSFPCSRLDWSTWRIAYTPVNAFGPSLKRGFTTTFGGKCLKRKQLFKDRSRKTAVYEVSVQTKTRGKRHVVYSQIVTRKGNCVDWEHDLLLGGRKRLLNQIQSVVDFGCKVFVRRALVSKRQLSKLDSLKDYSYAWSPQKFTRKPRRVVRDNVMISDNCSSN
ncbi:uncharacterized protein LOC132549169 [Ylistrum balloti]|uniref:uncharacterized protein LOC132549169 n=1 Tax=Ylistrum balloti TaxID=509963 RepID=UPI002905BF91|nr:uncharacterized protein LOC132549169 [Ylistrum balloti]